MDLKHMWVAVQAQCLEHIELSVKLGRVGSQELLSAIKMRVGCILSAVILFLLACSDEGLPAGPRSGGFNLGDTDKESQVLAILDERGIPFDVGSRGRIIYMLANQAEVLGVIRQVQTDRTLNPNYFESTILENEVVKKMYVDEFESSSIPYRLMDSNGLEYISWSQIYGPKVDLIRQKININKPRN